jgi:hypothetical protein
VAGDFRVSTSESGSQPLRVGEGLKVAAVIATYNRARYLKPAIESLLCQSRPVDELIVVDDGSTDETAELVSTFGSRVRYFHKSNGGKSSALNLALSQTTVDAVWLFDDDDLALPDALQRLEAALVQRGVDFSYGPQTIGWERADGSLRFEDGGGLPPVDPGRLFHYALTRFPFRMQGMLIRMGCFGRVGTFDLRFKRGQDYEFLVRLLRQCRGAPVPQPVFIWRVHEGVRGAGAASHAGSDRQAVWLQYDVLLGEAIRQDLALGEYLHPRVTGGELTPALRRRALLQRMVVMGSKALMDAALEDLEQASSIAGVGSDGFGVDEELACRLLATHGHFLDVWNEKPAFWQARWLAAAGNRAPDVLRAMARGFAWTARKSRYGWRQRLRLASASAALFGASLRGRPPEPSASTSHRASH